MSDNTAFGKPISGTINESTRHTVEQADPSVLEEAINALFEFPEVEAFQWDQYTPYFNDGDACEFSVKGYSFAVKFTDIEDDPYYGDGFYRYDDGLIEYDYDWESRTRHNTRFCDSVREALPVKIQDDLITALNNLFTQLDNGTHEIFLRRTFGDHATITATREGFDVETAQHD